VIKKQQRVNAFRDHLEEPSAKKATPAKKAAAKKKD
jgi:hypothetical protein